MIPNVGDADSSLRIGVEDLLNEVFALGREKLGHRVLCSHDLFVQVRRLWVFEGQVSGDHGVKDDTT